MNFQRFLRLTAFRFALCAACGVAQTASDPNEGSRLSRDPVTGVYAFSWWGTNGRTYFLQQSENLADWTYLPVIESGAGQIIQWGMSTSTDRSFLRLRSSNVAIADPFSADFDGDGVGNFDELLQGTDPLAWRDGDGAHPPNGMPDEWELYCFGSMGVDPTADPDGDGRTNLAEFQQRSNPLDFYNGHHPLLAKVSGDQQNGYSVSETIVSPATLAPMTVRVTDAATGNAYADTLITFAFLDFAGVQVATSADPGAAWQAAVGVATDAAGYASAWVKMPAAVPPVDQMVTASIKGGGIAQFIIHVPNGLDTDGNGLADPWERTHFAGLGHDPGGDEDHDGLSNADEMLEGADPNKPDTDGDGMPDGQDAVANDPDLKIPRHPAPQAYAVIDLKDFVPTSLNNLGQIAGYRYDGIYLGDEHGVFGLPGVWSQGAFYALDVDFPVHHFEPDPPAEHGQIEDEWFTDIAGIDDRGNVYFTDCVDLGVLSGGEDPSFVGHAHFNGAGFDPVVVQNGDDFRHQEDVFRVTAGGTIVSGKEVLFSWNGNDYRTGFRMAVNGGILQGSPDGNDHTLTINGKVYHNEAGWDDRVYDFNGFAANDSGQAFGVMAEGFGTTHPEDMTRPHIYGSILNRLLVWPGGGNPPVVLAEGNSFPSLWSINNYPLVTGYTADLGATVWIGTQNWKRKALPLAPGLSASNVYAPEMNNRGQSPAYLAGLGGCLWQNTRLFPLAQLTAGSGYKDVSAGGMNNSGMMIGSAVYVPSGPDDPVSAGTKDIALLPLTISSDKAWKEKKIHTFAYKPDATSIGKSLTVYYNAVRTPDDLPGDFDVHLDTAPIEGIVWSKVAGPDSGTLLDTDKPRATFRNPKVGGLYVFQLAVAGQAVGKVQLFLPVAGPDISYFWEKEIDYFKRVFGPLYRKHLDDQFDMFFTDPAVLWMQEQAAAIYDIKKIGNDLDWNGDVIGSTTPFGLSVVGGMPRLTLQGTAAGSISEAPRYVISWAKRNNMMYALIGREMGILEPFLRSFGDIANLFSSGTLDSPEAYAAYRAGFDLHKGMPLGTVMSRYGNSMHTPDGLDDREWPSREVSRQSLRRQGANALYTLINH